MHLIIPNLFTSTYIFLCSLVKYKHWKMYCELLKIALRVTKFCRRLLRFDLYLCLVLDIDYTLNYSLT